MQPSSFLNPKTIREIGTTKSLYTQLPLLRDMPFGRINSNGLYFVAVRLLLPPQERETTPFAPDITIETAKSLHRLARAKGEPIYTPSKPWEKAAFRAFASEGLVYCDTDDEGRAHYSPEPLLSELRVLSLERTPQDLERCFDFNRHLQVNDHFILLNN